MTRSFGPCLCGDPECRRCFPAQSPAPCPCCQHIVNCRCEWSENSDEDGADYCVMHAPQEEVG
jgi:hypothetical protein